MTIGPDPMTRTRWRSVRRGISRLRAQDKRLRAQGSGLRRTGVSRKPVTAPSTRRSRLEQIIRVVRAGRRLRVVLHREDRARRVRAAPRSSRRTGSRASPRRPRGSEPASTANPWFCAVISTRPVSRSFTGWFPPRCPNLSLNVRPPSASASTWWPRQMPNSRQPGVEERAHVRDDAGSAAGSPGPLLRKTPSGRAASTSRAGVAAGKTRTRAAVRGEAPEDVPLHAEVVGGDERPAAGRRRARAPPPAAGQHEARGR